MGTKKGIVLGALMFATVLAGRASAEPSYLVYPSTPAVFRFDASRYELVVASNPKFDPSFAIGSTMLWDRVESRIPVEIYRAPFLTGFEPSPSGLNEFVTYGNDFDVIVDGFGILPRTLGNLCLRFWPQPNVAALQVFIDGEPLRSLTASLAPVDVSTALPGGFFADTDSHGISWLGAAGMEIIAFSDKDGDRAFAGTPAFRILALSAAVAVEETTWGGVKALYRNP
ncbi:MAG TPA: hypothetical protein VFX92_00750 [Candidatus Krumholzibacteria bacterium]|nr:hypothetical protein [Candidatus Krumholzibacteria bacterium]